jgi:hypothetical protein
VDWNKDSSLKKEDRIGSRSFGRGWLLDCEKERLGIRANTAKCDGSHPKSQSLGS